VKNFVRDFKMGLDFEVYGEASIRHSEGGRELPYLIIATQIIVGRVWRRLLEGTVCRVKGHDWVDTSGGGPDHGWESGHCERCGWSFHNTMY